jgi:protein TonB
MPYKFFDNLLMSKSGRTKRKLTLPVSIGIHVVVLAAVLLVPLLTFSELPDPVMSSAIRAYLVEAAPAPPPPPPPPPPPAASAPKTVTQPKVEQPKPVVEEPKFTAPIEIPKEIPKPEPATGLDSGPGEPGGEIGGVQGGVKGGTEGGVVGGTIGGVPGGELGGQLGGVPGGLPKVEEPPPAPSGPVRVGGKIKAPSKLNNVPPNYPQMAKQARVEGTVILEATISPDGRVTDVKVLRGIPLLDNSAVDAVRQWKYSPTLLNGTPVPVVMTVTVNFRLNGDGRSSAPAVKAAPEAPAAATPPAEAPAPETAPTPPPSR